MADLVGRQIGNYRIIRQLGMGGFASMYLAEHMFTKDQVAIEVLPSRPTGKDLESFLAEARLTSRLVNPHILQTLEFGVEGDIPFIVTAYAPNGSLRQRHPRGSIVPLATLVSYVRQVANALQYLHNQRIIHRDVKPENMLLGRNDEVLLSDFGIAITVQSTSNQTAQDIVGTPTYMAPEQFQGTPGPASDQYALGVVVYEWLSGNPPFHGSTSTEIALKHLNDPPPPLREKVPGISPAVEIIVLTALAKEPRQRFDTVQAFANALEQASNFAQSTIAAQQPWVSPKEQTPPVAPSIDRCPYCGAETRPGDNFCLNCGNRLLPATPSYQQATPLSGEATIPGSDDWGGPVAPAFNDRTVAESAAVRDDGTATVQATLDKIENPARFIVRDDKGDVLQEHRLEKLETIIGRAPSSDILLSKDKLTSRRHAVVRYENGDYVLSDERSANGTFVNGQQLEELTPRILKDGDHIGIGEHELIFRISTGVEDLPTIAVPPDAVASTVTKAKDATHRTFAIARTTLEKDDRAFVGKVYSVEAGISQSKPEGFEGEPIKLPLRSSIRFLFLDILLHTSSNIELISHWQRRLRYDSHNPEPQLVAFKFKVVAPGSCSLAIDFYYERRWLKTIRFAFDAVEQSQFTAVSSGDQHDLRIREHERR